MTKMAVDGELNIHPEEDITIELENILMNTGLSFNKRNRRDLYDVFTGKIRIGSEDNPVPCGVKVHIKLMGNVSDAEEFGALGNSIPVGAKAIGGYGSVEMHGCKRDILHTYLQNTVSSGNTIEIDQETDWAVGEEIVIAASSFDHRETEYFTITAKNGKIFTLDSEIKHRHLGAADSVLPGNWNSKARVIS